MRIRTVAGCLILLVPLEGCMYTRSNLSHGKGGYENYPTSIEAEFERRKTRRRRALIAAPIEIVGGMAITYLALFASSEPSTAESTSGVIKDAGKELLARLLFASLGAGVAISGVGDGLLGAVAPAFKSPLVREGRLVPSAEIDAIAPPRGARFGIDAGMVLAEYGVGSELGIGLSHWITSTVRMRYTAVGELTLPWGSADKRLLGSGEVLIERAFGREHAGLYPRCALGFYAAGGWAAIEDRQDVPVARTGLAFAAGRGVSYRLGTSYSSGDRRPLIELVVRSELRLD